MPVLNRMRTRYERQTAVNLRSSACSIDKHDVYRNHSYKSEQYHENINKRRFYCSICLVLHYLASSRCFLEACSFVSSLISTERIIVMMNIPIETAEAYE